MDLSSVNVQIPQVGVIIGWPVSVEGTVVARLLDFVGPRPVKSAQALAKPWRF